MLGKTYIYKSFITFVDIFFMPNLYDMRKLLLMLLAGSSMLVSGASSADLNLADAAGYLSRGRLMWADRNYEGCLDQMLNVIQLTPTPEQREEAERYMALATLGIGDDEALPMLEAWLRKYPESVHRQEMMKAVGDVLFNTGSYREAVEQYAKVDPAALTETQAADMLYREAYSLLMLGDYAEAETKFESLLADNRYRNAARYYMAYIAYARKDYSTALQLFRKVDTSAAPGASAPYYMAQIYFMQGDYSDALASARKAISADLIPSFTNESRRIAGESLYAMGNLEDAVGYLWDYAAKSPNPAPSAYYILGIDEWNRGDYNAAGKLFQQAVNEDNAMGQSAYLYLGQTYLKQGNTNSALMAFQKAYEMNYDPATRETAFYNYAVAKSNGGKAPFENSAAIFEDFIESYPDSRYAPAVQNHIVSGYLSDGNYAKALEAADKFRNPTAEVLTAKQRALLGMAVNEINAGNAADALSHLQAVYTVSGGSAAIAHEARIWEGDSYMLLSRPADAAKAYAEYLAGASADDPNRGLALYNLGYARYQLKEYESAREDLTDALATGGLDARLSADARNRIADCLYYDKKYSQALAQYRQAAETSPATADYSLYQAAVMKGLTGDNNAKIAGLDEMMASFPASPYVAEALLEKASAQTALSQTAAANATYSRLLKEYPLTAQGRRAALILAINAQDERDMTKAIRAYQGVIKAYPSSDEARIASDDLKQIMADAGRLDDYVAFMESVPGAPSVDKADIDRSAFQAAEKAYAKTGDTAPLAAYITRYPGGMFEAEALYYLAENATAKGNVDEAVDYSRRVVDTYPKSTVAEDARVILAEGLLNQGNGDAALDQYRQLAQSASSPRNILAARMGIMTNSLRAGDDAAVIEESDKVLAMTDVPTASLNETRFMRGLALSRSGKTAEAEAEWAEVASQVNDVNGSKSAVYLAQSMLGRGDAKGAAKTINKFIDASPAQPYWLARGFIVLSDALRAEGNTFEADQYLKTLKANYPGKQPDIFLMIDQRLSRSKK